jgi:aldehyde:ferredoxin oxidoreductase
MEEPVPDGPHEGMRCSREELNSMLDSYYRLRGWTDDGIPTKEKLQELELGFVADELWQTGGRE